MFDRGMVSSEHLYLLEAQGLTYLSAMDKDEIACHPLFQEFAHSFQLSAVINKTGETEARRLDGITCFITNDTTIPQTEIIQRYREKNKIEEAFREMKSLLALRPIHLTRPERVKAHVTVCILAYLLVNTMEMMLKKAQHSISPIEVIAIPI